VQGEESSFFIIGQEARDSSSTILRQSGVKYRGIPPPLCHLPRCAGFSQRIATPTSKKVYGQVRFCD
jgi:hypothetical protein